MLINLWVKDKRSGTIHQVGTDVHDSLNFIGEKVVYYNLQNGCGAGFGEEDGYEWVDPPDLDDYVRLTPEQLYLSRELVHKDIIDMMRALK